MSKLTGGLGGLGGGLPFLMEYYSSHISKLIEELGRLRESDRNPPRDWRFTLSTCPGSRWRLCPAPFREAKEHVRYCSICCTLTDQEICPICSNPSRIRERLWWWKIPEIWQPMKKQGSTTASIMFFTEPSPLCWASGPDDIKLKETDAASPGKRWRRLSLPPIPAWEGERPQRCISAS